MNFNLKLQKDILHLALPVIAGSSTQMIVSIVDTAMVGRLGNATFALAAMGIGVLATWALVSFFSSLATGTHVMIARRFGATDYIGCGKVLNTSLIMSFLIGIVVSFAGIYFSYDIANFFAADKNVGELAGEYLSFRFIGIPFFLLTVSYRGFFFGIGKTKIFMISGILVNFLNIIFNYIFIFGAFGLPEMGLAGAGLGSTLATFFDAIFYFSVTTLVSYRKKYKYFRNIKLLPEIARSIVSIALPVSFQNVFILIGFLSFIGITGIIGTAEQAASQVIVSALFISFMPSFGFGAAVQTLVGNNLGRGKIIMAKKLALETAKIATYYTVLIGIIFYFFPHLVLLIITTETEVINTAIPSLKIAGITQIFYAVGIVLSNGLQAAGRTLFVMITEVLSNLIIFVPLSYLFGIVMGYGLEGAWAALPFYIIIFSLVIFIKFAYSDWTKIKEV